MSRMTGEGQSVEPRASATSRQLPAKKTLDGDTPLHPYSSAMARPAASGVHTYEGPGR